MEPRRNPRETLLHIEQLRVGFPTDVGIVEAVRDVDLDLYAGEIHGIAGESGSGKTTLARSILRLNHLTTAVVTGRIVFEGEDLRELSPSRVDAIRGRKIGFIPQDAAASLNPYHPLAQHFREALGVHRGMHRNESLAAGVQALRDVGFSEPDQILKAFPHQLSTGMCQRAAIALAVSLRPRILIADEPTASLDAISTVEQAELLSSLKERLGISILLITHDLDFLFGSADRITVFYAGEVVESSSAEAIRDRCEHPYTKGLLASRLLPRGSPGKLSGIPGDPPRLEEGVLGCRFQPRCGRAIDECTSLVPQLSGTARHTVRCFNPCRVSNGQAAPGEGR